ncbi:MAG: hypothetical protein KIT80_23385 [Chitinophagaceae bacterium]|nr:hypothetical protein [Nitrosomonas sp.]MCW5929883.1 hypothetical protein [Chitinophagaceae bacterium]
MKYRVDVSQYSRIFNYFLEGKSIKDIADEVGLSHSVVRGKILKFIDILIYENGISKGEVDKHFNIEKSSSIHENRDFWASQLSKFEEYFRIYQSAADDHDGFKKDYDNLIKYINRIRSHVGEELAGKLLSKEANSILARIEISKE